MATKQFKDYTAKTTPIDTDISLIQEVGLLVKKVTWANTKATLKTYFDTLYQSILTVASNITIATIELGHASDTTISRSSGGVIAVEGIVVPTISSTSTLTNKRITKRTLTVAQSATPAINTDNGDIFQITGLAQAITSMTTSLTGTPVDGDMIMIQITDNGTARAITWGTSFASTTVTLPTTTVISTMLRVVLQWSSGTSKWNCVGIA